MFLFYFDFYFCPENLKASFPRISSFSFAPGISIGFTQYAGTNFGFSFDLGYNCGKKIPCTCGISFNQYYMRTKKYTHRLRNFSLMYQTSFSDVKLGVGRARNKWGYGNGNACIVRGINYEVSFTVPGLNGLWVGYRRFRYNQSAWAWFYHPAYNSFFTRYSYDLIQDKYLQKQITILPATRNLY